jgi:hypothetical protein
VLIVDAIRKIVKIAVFLKYVQIAQGRNLAAGLIFMSRELVTSDIFNSSRSNILVTTILPLDVW